MYIDGSLGFSGTDTDTWNIANDILIGSNHGGDPSSLSLSFTGLIDEVAIFNTALSAADVAAHFAAATAAVPEPSAITLWLLIGIAGIAVGIYRRKRRRD